MSMAETFAVSFSSVYVTEKPDNPWVHQVSAAVMDQLRIDYDIECKVLENIDASSSPGPDGIHQKIMRSC